MKTPFYNDMFSLVDRAFKNLYPDKEYDCCWVAKLKRAPDRHKVLGKTVFDEEGKAHVYVVATLKVMDALAVFAHELAHVAVGNDVYGHGEDWSEAYDKIFNEYNRIGFDEYETHEAVSVTDGKAYVRESEYEREGTEGTDQG